MSEALLLGELDVDGALAEGTARVEGTTRAELLRGTAVGGAVLLGLVAGPSDEAEAQGRIGASDADILNFALALEYLQAAFYSEVERLGSLEGALARQARVVGAHERAHVKSFKATLGSRAIRRPRFDFGGATEDPERFRRTAVAFEDLSVAAYKGQAPRIRRRDYLVPALAVHAVEARHAAWIRRLAGVRPAETAFDAPRSRASTLRVVADTDFTVRTRSRRRPRYTG